MQQNVSGPGSPPPIYWMSFPGIYGGIYASNIIRFSKVYRVIIQASPEYRLDTHSLDNIYFKNGDEMAPVSQYVTLTKTSGPKV